MNWQLIQIPFGRGLFQKTDVRASNPPSLDRAVDVQFDESEGLQTRKPFAAFGVNVFGGGTLSNVRKLAVVGNELLAFTDVALYSWNAQLAVWISKAEYLAATVTENARFVTTGDQVTCDRAELNNTVMFTWADSTNVWISAMDKTTGAVLMAPAKVVGYSRPRLVAVATKIMFFASSGTSLDCYAFDPANPASVIGGGLATVQSGASYDGTCYDVCRKVGADAVFYACRRGVTTSYTIGTVDSARTVTTAVKARVADGPIAIACHPLGTSVQVIRKNVHNVEGDLLTSALADTYTGQAIGTIAVTDFTIDQIGACFRSVTTGGQYRCYVWWSWNGNAETSITNIRSNWVNDANALGTAANMFTVNGVSLACPGTSVVSRPFDYNGRVYIHVEFYGISGSAGKYAQLENTLFLYRDDALLIAKENATTSGGAATAAAYTQPQGWLPGISNPSTGVYVWVYPERRVIQLGTPALGYGARSPREITIAFDQGAARRSATLGQTLYITGGEVLQYDGSGLYEVGFHIYPWSFYNFTHVAGSIPAGNYTWRGTDRWDNARGERERSTTATYINQTTAGAYKVSIDSFSAVTTHKTTASNGIAREYWRTVTNAPTDAPYYRVTSNDPSTVGADNGYIANGSATTLTLVDNYTDTILTTQEQNPEIGSVLESVAPPAATLITNTQYRVFLAGIANDPNVIWYSRLRGDAEIVGFNDGLKIDVPNDTGPITALGFQEETLVAFTSTGIYALPGVGLDNTGGGSNYGPARIISTDCGCVNAESLCYTPAGLIFKSSKGWYRLAGWQPEFIGAPVVDYDSETIVSVEVMPAQHQIRAVSSGRILVFDYVASQWAEWSITGAVSAVLWNGVYVYATSSAIYSEQSNYGGVTYGLDVETSWIKMADLQGAGRVRWIGILGEYRDAHTLRVRVARDYAFGTDVSATAKSLDLTAPVKTNAVPWNATLFSANVGEVSNRCVLAVYFKATGGASSITVQDGYTYNGTVFQLATSTITSVLIQVGNTDVTVGALETAINAGSSNLFVGIHDPTASKVISGNTLGVNSYIQFTGGVDASSATYESDVLWTPDPATVGGPLQVRIGPSVQRCEAFKVRITAVVVSSVTYNGVVAYQLTAPAGESLKLSGLALEVGIERGLYRRLPVAQKD